MAFKPLLRPFLQEGQMSAEVSVAVELVDVESEDELLKVTAMRVFREIGCE